MNRESSPSGLLCPMPILDATEIRMAHGGGGRLSQDLLERVILPRLGGRAAELHDAALLPERSGRWAVATDGFVVRPLFFPGGDIGSLAVHGTVNDLLMAGAQPVALTLSLILEEGLPIAVLEHVLDSVAEASLRCGVRVVAGDTKVVGRGEADGLYLAMTGLGVVAAGRALHPRRVCAGDRILVSGDLGRHGLAILNARENLGFETDFVSDSAPLLEPVQRLLEAVEPSALRVLRDVTRGGLAGVLHEIADAASLAFEITEAAVPVEAPVRSACALLGLDPLQLACEGRFVAIVAPEREQAALAALRATALGRAAVSVGQVVPGQGVWLDNPLGLRRAMAWGSGELLPRIC
ncbi:MAG TPA: hydrogenase expression/formation protein HypE [Candidatus Acidoferrales bacterium]|nr:hydrogenase expression/formation protein HypE [Candidatus Acidoferrales bacterium]